MIAEKVCGLSVKVQEALRGVFNEYPKINKVILYGSRAMGTFKTGSDIDMTLDGDELTTQDLLAIATKIDNLNLQYKVDLSILQQVDHQNLLEHIKRVGIVF